MSNTETMYSRGQSCALGKCTAEIKTLVPEELRDVIAGLAAIEGKTVSEYTRELFMTHAYGHFHSIRMTRHGRNGIPD